MVYCVLGRRKEVAGGRKGGRTERGREECSGKEIEDEGGEE